MGIILNKQIFIEKSSQKHNSKYDYSFVNYVDGKTKVKIICQKHGEFYMSPTVHIYGQGCPKCGREKITAASKKITNEIFIQKAKKKHGSLYDYSEVNYINPKTKIKITCKIHGEFEQLPHSHLRGSGCPMCGASSVWNKTRSNKEQFIDKSIKTHKNKYDYSKLNYENARKSAIIICPKHGEFKQSPQAHLRGQGCSKCANENSKDSLETFIGKAVKTHGNKYDYSKTIYKNSKEHVIIICPEHGEFKQNPSSHIRGYGCPFCHDSIGERNIRIFLENNKIDFIPQKKFNNCKNIKELPFDFYIPSLNICIEYDGEQHFRPIKYFGGKEGFLKTKKRDQIKTEYCNSNHIFLFRISYKDNVEKFLKSIVEEFLPC